MGKLNMIFRKKKEPEESGSETSQEDYRNIRVMRDDLDELSGKAPKTEASATPSVPEAPQVGNPFLGGTDSPAPVPTNASRQADSLPDPVPMPSMEDVAKPSPEQSSKGVAGKTGKWFIYGGGAVLVLAVAGAVLVYFFNNSGRRQGETVSENAPVQDAGNTAAAPDPALSSPENTQSFSVSNPNYLQFDTESPNATPESVATILEETSAKVASMPTTSPVEFLIRDMNNNPIAFSRFAHLLGLKLPSEILSNVNESFSISFVPDGPVVRRAIVINTKDSSNLQSAAQKYETSLPALFGALLYGKNFTIPATPIFHDGTFGALKTRYAIIDSDIGSSLDHIIVENAWVVGTSKDSFRAVLGKIVQEQSKN